MPSNLVLVFKTIAMLEGISLQLDPDINVFAEVEPYVRDALLELQSPVARAKQMVEQLRDSGEALAMLPQQLQRMLEQIELGEGNLSMTLKGVDEPAERITAAANRLVLAILAAAFIFGPALLIPRIHEIWPEWQTAVMVLVVAGFLLSLLITFGLILSIWRSGR
jgi:ubiquinone biosynthesis protein